MNQKDWTKQMGKKFLNWRQVNNYTGTISVPEVANFAQDLIIETKEIFNIKK